MMLPSTIAIDGPAASGKSALAMRLAERLNYIYLDTGLMYRAVTNEALQRGVAVEDQSAVTELARSLDINVLPAYKENAFPYIVTVNGRDVSAMLHRPEVDRSVSKVSAYAGVRQAMTEKQRKIARRGRVIMAGRDIGTVVLPDAECKIYLTASVPARAARRRQDRLARGAQVTAQEMEAEIERRDEQDSTREVAPLRRAADAVVLDNTDLNIEETLERALAIVHARARAAA